MLFTFPFLALTRRKSALWPVAALGLAVLAGGALAQADTPPSAVQPPTQPPTLRQALDAAWQLSPAARTEGHRRSELAARDKAAASWLGAWAAEGTSAANWPQRFIFRRFLTQYLDIGVRNRQKLPSLGPIFASTPSAAQAPSGRSRCCCGAPQ